VHYIGADQSVWVKGDDFALEDVVTHILANAQRYRLKGTPISITLELNATQVIIGIHNQGPVIDADLLPHIFDYGVSSNKTNADDASHRGQGLFVAKTYMSKMGGSIQALNVADGVVFKLSLIKA
jgi:K+-sensing histidine kinase KdpD